MIVVGYVLRWLSVSGIISVIGADWPFWKFALLYGTMLVGFMLGVPRKVPA